VRYYNDYYNTTVEYKVWLLKNYILLYKTKCWLYFIQLHFYIVMFNIFESLQYKIQTSLLYYTLTHNTSCNCDRRYQLYIVYNIFGISKKTILSFTLTLPNRKKKKLLRNVCNRIIRSCISYTIFEHSYISYIMTGFYMLLS